MAFLPKIASFIVQLIYQKAKTSTFTKNYAGLYYVVEQTSYLKPIFDTCQNQDLCVLKHEANSQLEELKTKNKCQRMNL